MEKIRWGVLGTANIAKNCTIPGMKLAKNCELYAIAGRNLKKADEFREEFGFKKSYGSYEELLEDEQVQAVYIPLPNNLHAIWVKEALKLGKHVLCEKPLALNENEAAELYRTAEENGVYLMEAFAYLHSPYIKSLKQDIDAGLIGDIVFIDTAFVTQGYKDDIRIRKETGGGAMYDLGCYCTTMILSLTGSEPEFVKADAEFSDQGVDIVTNCMIRFENGVRATFNVGMILGKDTNDRYDRLYIHGTKGYIISEVEYNQEGNVSYRIYSSGVISERTIQVPQNYSLETEQLGRCILEGEKPFVTPEFSLKNAGLMDRILKEIGYVVS